MRFFLKGTCGEIGGVISLMPEDARHLASVLRKRPGDRITVCDAAAFDCLVELTEVSPQAVRGRILSRAPADSRLTVEVTLYQGLPKAAKMEEIIQKAVELGVYQVVPVLCRRSVVQLDQQAAGKKRLRWQKIAEAAAKQSNRALIPQVQALMPFDQAVREMAQADLAFLPWEEERQVVLPEVLVDLPCAQAGDRPRIAFLIGPEGGLTRDEAGQMTAAGIATVSLGPTILRTETAGPATMAMLLYRYGFGCDIMM